MNKEHSIKPVLSPISKAVRLSLFGLSLVHGASQAATIEVNSHLDDNGTDCTLRQAIVSMNNGTSAGLQGGCVYTGTLGVADAISFEDNLASNTITERCTLFPSRKPRSEEISSDSGK